MSLTQKALGVTLIFAIVAMIIQSRDQILQKTDSKEQEQEEDISKYPIVVIGSGLAGMSAAIEAVDAGATQVIILEKTSNTGGNSAKASSGMNAVNTLAQQKKQINDSASALVSDTLISGRSQDSSCASDEKLVAILAEQSTSAWEWLSSQGIQLNEISQCGGHSAPRTHRYPEVNGKPTPVGWGITSTLRKTIDSKYKDKITILTGVTAEGLITNSKGSVIGVKYPRDPVTDSKEMNPKEKDIVLKASSVVLATGGFCAGASDPIKPSLLEEFAPELKDFPTTNGPWAVGQGMRMAREIGAELIHMDKIQVHPTGFIDPKTPNAPQKFLAPEMLRGVGAVLLNHEGKRFVNELGLRDHVTEAILTHCQKMADGPVRAFLVLNDEAVASFGSGYAAFYMSKGLLKRYDNVEKFAEADNLDPEVVKASLLEIKVAAESDEKKDRFGRKVFPIVFNPEEPIVVAWITPALHYTMGGVRVDTNAKALRKDGSVINGLYAAGEVTGGVHGKNRLAGNSLLECVVFGRIAGKQAAQRLTSQT